MSSKTYYGTATATSSASASATASASASATSNISQEEADILALELAKKSSQQIALTNATQELTSITLYVALIFQQASYDTGLSETLLLIQSEFPNSKVVYEKYVTDLSVEQTENALKQFVQKYPTGNRVTVSELSGVLNVILNYLEKNNIDIFSLSLNATSVEFKLRKNLFTYGYFLNTIVTSSFLIIEDYGVKNIVILIDNQGKNLVFFNSLLTEIKIQNKLLNNLPLTVFDLSNVNEKITIPQNSFVYLLAETPQITNIYLNTILDAFYNNTTSCLFLTTVNNDIKDIFNDIPAFVYTLCPVNYTITSNNVYENLQNKNFYTYLIYPFYDILYTLEFMSENGITVTNEKYISVSPFQSIPQAYSNSLQLNGSINGFDYGAYNITFTKNILLNTPELLFLYDKYNFDEGRIYKLPDSQSVFKITGIVPFFSSNLYYINENLIKIYENNILKYVKFDSDATKDDSKNIIAVSEIQEPKFIINYDKDIGLFNSLKKIYTDSNRTNPAVNPRMSKIDSVFYL